MPALTNHTGEYVFIQTLRVNLLGKNGFKIVCGPQRWYILKSFMEELGSKRVKVLFIWRFKHF